MTTFKTLVLMLCLTVSAALSQNNMAGTENGDGLPITIKTSANHGGSDKSNSIAASINGHILSVVFSENIGLVSTEITNENGATVDCLTFPTPTGYQLYVPLAGRYTATFTLSNGDEYYGDFEVEE